MKTAEFTFILTTVSYLSKSKCFDNFWIQRFTVKVDVEGTSHLILVIFDKTDDELTFALTAVNYLSKNRSFWQLSTPEVYFGVTFDSLSTSKLNWQTVTTSYPIDRQLWQVVSKQNTAK